jgi:FtsZ-binding cell division protein ZapB
MSHGLDADWIAAAADEIDRLTAEVEKLRNGVCVWEAKWQREKAEVERLRAANDHLRAENKLLQAMMPKW